jgi:hypothetical protein
MTPYTPELGLELWYRALETEFGLYIPLPDPEDAHYISGRMYEIRTEVTDPRLACLSIYIPAAANFIMLYKKEVELEP